MGKRRIRNLFANEEKNIIGFNPTPERRKEAEEKYGIKTIDDYKKVAAADFDAVVISSPPDTHGEYIRFAIAQKKHFFVEHPTLTDGYETIFANKNHDLVMVPSATFRFYTPLKMIKKFLEENRIGKILAYQYHMGQYLPDWHPWEDYRDVYFSKKETGACREMFPFELIWLNWLMGSHVANVSGFVNKVSNLDMKADDVLMASLKYKNGIMGNVLIDVIARAPFRTLRILGSDGVLHWERFNNEIKIFDSKTKTWETIAVPKGRPEPGYVNEEEMYNDEINTWLNAIRGKAEYPYTFEESMKNLAVLYKLESGGGEI
ncbi:Gfo/Idh/MocA family oxidoreductase [Candidatus Giovannonibacteria bacterium]|nr:Gfo/Idh/MocA family oxidoreductase [Candidatus Giovannonibacteria bacterium]